MAIETGPMFKACIIYLGSLVGTSVKATFLKAGVNFFAFAIASSVSVVSFGGNSVLLNPLKGVVHEATIATLVSVFGAIDQSLF